MSCIEIPWLEIIRLFLVRHWVLQCIALVSPLGLDASKHLWISFQVVFSSLHLEYGKGRALCLTYRLSHCFICNFTVQMWSTLLTFMIYVTSTFCSTLHKAHHTVLLSPLQTKKRPQRFQRLLRCHVTILIYLWSKQPSRISSIQSMVSAVSRK